VSSKKPAKPTASGSRGKRVVYLRLPVEVFQKLSRMVLAQSTEDERGTIQGVIISLIEQAREKRPST